MLNQIYQIMVPVSIAFAILFGVLHMWNESGLDDQAAAICAPFVARHRFTEHHAGGAYDLFAICSTLDGGMEIKRKEMR